ncbi:MAG TPA: hypothetical protein VK467_01535 [Gemmatimonadales bacterium]|nr:hypothetical protein [Gemmatimonadales bacterium]
MRTLCLAVAFAAVLAPRAPAQTAPAVRGMSLRQGAVHYGKWLTAGAAVAFTAMAVHEHGFSHRDWDNLLVICRSSDNACARGSDGRYLRADAEFLYERSIYYDRRANRRILGAQGSLLVTAALFIIDLSGRNAEPDNIPFRPLRVTLAPTSDGAAVGMRIAF